jgi:hypothetical protein
MFTEFQIELLEDFGDPVVFFKCFYVSEDSRTYFSTVYAHFFRFMVNNYPDEANYISKIRQSLVGYGTKEDQVVAILQEENFPLEKYAFAYWEAQMDVVEAEIERQKSWILINQKTDNALQKHAAAVVERLKPKFTPIKQSQLYDELEQAVASFFVDKFPEIINTDAEEIITFKKILSKYIQNLGLDMVNHIHKIRNL